MGSGTDAQRGATQPLGYLEARTRELENEVARRRRTEQQMHELLAVTTELAAAHDRAMVARIVVEAGRSAVGAMSSGLWLVTPEGGELELVAASQQTMDDARKFERVPIAGESPAAHVMRTGGELFLGTRQDYAICFPDSFVRLGVLHHPFRAIALLPVKVHEVCVGVMVYSYSADRVFDEAGRTFKRLLARQCAVALERVQLLEEERRLRAAAEAAAESEKQARMLADEATRAREEILSVVSHDLRNPLGAILMASGLLKQLGSAGDTSGRLQATAERIQRQASRMARFVTDLVDFAGIEAGRIALECGNHAPADMVAEVVDLVAPIASERGLVLEKHVMPELPQIHCDGDRIVQVLSNLVTNALKVTPKAGAVRIGAELDGDEIVFSVRDTGPGIDAAELPHLFRRHWRSKTSTYKGAGLGLSIARGIVDAHGGRIWVTSTLGSGSTFYFALSAQ